MLRTSFLIQAVAPAHCFYQAACVDDLHQILRQRGDRVLFSFTGNMLIYRYSNLIPFFYIRLNAAVLDQKQPVIDRIAKENTCKRFCDDTADAQGLDDLRCLFPGGTTAKVRCV